MFISYENNMLTMLITSRRGARCRKRLHGHRHHVHRVLDGHGGHVGDGGDHLDGDGLGCGPLAAVLVAVAGKKRAE